MSSIEINSMKCERHYSRGVSPSALRGLLEYQPTWKDRLAQIIHHLLFSNLLRAR